MSGTVYLTRIEPEAKRYRFYKLFLAPSLFGDWVLVRESGRIGHPGTVRLEYFSNPGAVLLAMQEVVRKKKRRGYQSL